jgi:hypothetical protein
MKMTNKKNLPEALVAAIESWEHVPSGADAHVTGLLNPPRITALRLLHRDDIVSDAADHIFALDGKVVHEIIERSGMGMKNVFGEVKTRITVKGWILTGRLDELVLKPTEPGTYTLDDFKRTSAYVVAQAESPGSRVANWRLQLNIYRYMMMKQHPDLVIDEMRLVFLLRDWSKLEAKRNKDYPQEMVVVMNVAIMNPGKVYDIIEEMVDAHQEAQQALDTGGQEDLNFPHCSPMERWERPTTYAVMKEGKVKALRVMTDLDELEKWVIDKNHGVDGVLKPGIEIIERPGERVRCENYCDVAPFCKQFQDWKNENSA